LRIDMSATGRPIRKDNPQKFTTTLSEKARKKLFRMATSEGTAINRVIERLVFEASERKGA